MQKTQHSTKKTHETEKHIPTKYRSLYKCLESADQDDKAALVAIIAIYL